MNEEFAGPGETSNGARQVVGRQSLDGTHIGAVLVAEGGHLVVNGVLIGSLYVSAGGRCTILGTVDGATVAEAGGEILTDEGAMVNGASTGVIGFGDLNGAVSPPDAV